MSGFADVLKVKKVHLKSGIHQCTPEHSVVLSRYPHIEKKSAIKRGTGRTNLLKTTKVTWSRTDDPNDCRYFRPTSVGGLEASVNDRVYKKMGASERKLKEGSARRAAQDNRLRQSELLGEAKVEVFSCKILRDPEVFRVCWDNPVVEIHNKLMIVHCFQEVVSKMMGSRTNDPAIAKLDVTSKRAISEYIYKWKMCFLWADDMMSAPAGLDVPTIYELAHITIDVKQKRDKDLFERLATGRHEVMEKGPLPAAWTTTDAESDEQAQEILGTLRPFFEKVYK